MTVFLQATLGSELLVINPARALCQTLSGSFVKQLKICSELKTPYEFPTPRLDSTPESSILKQGTTPIAAYVLTTTIQAAS